METEAKGVSELESLWAEFLPLRQEVAKAKRRKRQVPPDVSTRWRDLRNRLVNRYYHVVQKVARGVSTKIVEVEEETLASMGVDGLYDAVDKYDPDRRDKKTGRRIKFETFSAYRIKGAIIDSIRREDWVPRLVRARLKKIEAKRDAFVASHGRMPTDEEMAEAMGMPTQQYREFADSAKLRLVKSLSAACGRAEGASSDEESTVGDLLEDATSFEPLEHAKRSELLAKLFGRGFTPLERSIIHSYYFEGLSMADIGRALKISESSVSAKHAEIIKRLKDKVSRNPDYFGEPLLELLKR